MTDPTVRHSQAANATIIHDEEARAQREAENALQQAELVRQYIIQSIDRRSFRLRPSTLLDLNRSAIDGLDAYAGNWRPGTVEIGKSDHAPPAAHLVPGLAEELCDYVNELWDTAPSIHLAAVVMWRINWIHPFTDGNGRTSRAASYLVLCAHQKSLLPGTPTIPEQIVSSRVDYYNALEEADAAYHRARRLENGVVDELEKLLGDMLATQLANAFKYATDMTGD